MIEAPTLDEVLWRLQHVPHVPWGPDGVRYVAILFWDLEGYRTLYNAIDTATWDRWHTTSAETWDLFLAGCHQYGSDTRYRDRSLPLTTGDIPVLWSERQSRVLAQVVASNAMDLPDHAEGWTFRGPVELVVVGARREGGEVTLDWPSLRAMPIAVERIPSAIAAYTSAHGELSPETLKDVFPAPGDFSDDYPPAEVVRVMLRIAIKLGRRMGRH